MPVDVHNIYPGMETLGGAGSPVVVEKVDVIERHVVTMGAIGPRGPMGPVGPMGPAGASTLNATAGTPLGGHRVLAVDVSGNAVYADCTVRGHINKLIGLTTNAVGVGETFDVVALGRVEEPSWNWDVSLPIYLGKDGAMVQIIPSDAEFVVMVGFPMTPTKIFFSIGTYILKA